jgi:hypothetical protein
LFCFFPISSIVVLSIPINFIVIKHFPFCDNIPYGSLLLLGS